MASVLSYLANISEIIAGFVIVFSAIKVWPAFNNLNRLGKKEKNQSSNLQMLQSDLSKFTERPCPILADADAAIHQVLEAVLSSGSSDTHFELKEVSDVIQGSLRFRTDGKLKEVSLYPVGLHAPLIAAIKALCGLEGSVAPTQGRFHFDISSSGQFDIRVQITPTQLGERVALRIIDPSSAKMGFDQLGYSHKDLAALKGALDWNSGLIVCGGPTGSGKTVSLYTSLNSFDDRALNILSIEDPVEIDLPRISQHSVQDLPGHHFSDLYSAAIRSDPDVLMLGEIRNSETAGYCFRAANTGHLVLSTIHCMTATETLILLHQLAEDTPLPKTFIVNQRLARRLCRHCKAPRILSAGDQQLIDNILHQNQKSGDEIEDNFSTAVGCDKCSAGYRGRVGGYETLQATQQLIDLAAAASSDASRNNEVEKAAIEAGMTTIGFHLLKKASNGETTLEEIRRLLSDS